MDLTQEQIDELEAEGVLMCLCCNTEKMNHECGMCKPSTKRRVK